MHSSTIGASRDRSATCSTRSRKVGSAHWRSSNTTTSGRRRASASNSRRTAQKIFSLVLAVGVAEAERLRHAGGDQVGLRLVGELRRDGGTVAPSASAPVRSRTTSASGQYVMPSP